MSAVKNSMLYSDLRDRRNRRNPFTAKCEDNRGVQNAPIAFSLAPTSHFAVKGFLRFLFVGKFWQVD